MNRGNGPVIIGVLLQDKNDYEGLLDRVLLTRAIFQLMIIKPYTHYLFKKSSRMMREPFLYYSLLICYSNSLFWNSV